MALKYNTIIENHSIGENKECLLKSNKKLGLFND